MFLRRLLEISDFRAFKNWKDDEQKRPHTFGLQNIIFGPNGSGKSTFVDLAWRVKQKQCDGIVDPILQNVFVELFDGEKVSKHSFDSDNVPKFQVFGKEYIKANLYKAFAEGEEGAALYVFGEANKNLEKDIQVEGEVLEGIQKELVIANGILIPQENATRNVLENVKQDVYERLSKYDPQTYNTNTFNITKAEDLVNSQNRLLTIEQLAEEMLNLEITAESIPNDIMFQIPDFPDNIAELCSDLASYNVTSRALEELAANPEISSWVEVGLTLHDPGENCAFCGNTVSEIRVAELNGHFDESHKLLKKKLSRVGKLLGEWEQKEKELKTSLEIQLFERMELKEVCQRHASDISEYRRNTADWIERARNLIDYRTSHPQKDYKWNPPPKPSFVVWDSIDREVGEINNELQIKRGSVSQINENAERAILSHIGAKHYESFQTCQTQENEGKRLVSECTERRNMSQTRLLQLEAKRNNQHDGQTLAEALSRDLVGYLGYAELTVEYIQDDSRTGFLFLRNGHAATDLSEGERNAISLLHFLRSLESVDCVDDLGETCIVIDDPVSSMDSDSIIAAFSFILTSLRDLNGVIKCKQLII